VKDILGDAKTVNLTPESSKFWILVHALKGFVENEGAGFLPLPGSLSDMTSTTEGYIKLQTL
jgi:amyloid beta precursor protein binding protein 1